MDKPISAKPEALIELPFDLTSVIGEIKSVSLESPGVYYVGAKKEPEWLSNTEYYIVTADAPAISDEARSYGYEVPEYPGLRLYDRGG